jgi:hypothetical protein
VNGDGIQRNEAGSSPWADDSAADVVEQGGRRRFPSLNWPSPNWRPPRNAVILLAVGLVIGLAAGYAAGYRQGPRPAGTPTTGPSSASPLPGPAPLQTFVVGTPMPIEGSGAVIPGAPALTQDTGTCFMRSGRQLQLGVQVTNGSAKAIGLGQIRTVLPLGGLRVISQQWAPCGAIGAVQVPASLGPGDSAWFSVTVQVLVACPGPLPVEFTVDYTWAGEHAAVNLPGFSDLSRVSYPGCTGG